MSNYKPLMLEQRVVVKGMEVIGSVAYVGYPSFATGKWIGVILDEPKGKNNGTVRGHAYFTCKDNFGMFVRETQIKLLDGKDNPIETSMSTQSKSESLSPATKSQLSSLIITDIHSLPHVTQFERPLHVKRRRLFSSQPSISKMLKASSKPKPQDQVLEAAPPLAPPVLPVAESSSALPVPESSVKVESEGLPVPSECSPPPSPGLFLELNGTGARRPSNRILFEEDIAASVNYESEPESDESDVEEDRTEDPEEYADRHSYVVGEGDGEDDTHQADVVLLEAIGSVSQEVYKPNNFFDFEWRSFPNLPIPHELRRETFSEINVGPTAAYAGAYEIFTAIWDRKIMEHIASETNRYAQELALQRMADGTLCPNSRICDWQDTSVDELYVYFAIILAMGSVNKSRIEDYWSTNQDIFYTPGFAVYMTLRRYLLITRCLHFNSNKAMSSLKLDDSEAKLFKIQPVVSHLNNKFQNMYILSRNIFIDESLLLWKSWLSINQFIRNKTASVGIKTYELCESQTGYLFRFDIYTHKRGPSQSADPLEAFTPAIVLKLLQGLENKGHTVWMDNFYNSPALARKLKTLGFDCAGTLRTNRKFVPQALDSLTKSNMRPGQIVGCTSGDVDLLVWRDQNRVAMISTYHGNVVTSTPESTKPTVVMDYNIMMGGVDKKDQMLSAYLVERKRSKIWYKKLFRRLLNVSVLNTFIIFKSQPSAHRNLLNHSMYRIHLVKSILERHSSEYSSSFPAMPSNPTIAIDKHWPAYIHHPAEYPLLPGLSGRQRRQCVVCRKRIHTYCKGCDKTVCCIPCFGIMHSKPKE